jgi:hypothetical protein
LPISSLVWLGGYQGAQQKQLEVLRGALDAALSPSRGCFATAPYVDRERLQSTHCGHFLDSGRKER